MADNGLVASLVSGHFGSANLPDDGVSVLAVFRPGDAAPTFLKLVRERLSRAGYSNISLTTQNSTGDLSNVTVLAVGWRKPVHAGKELERRLDASRALAASQAAGRLVQEYFFSPQIQDGESTVGRAIVLVLHRRRQQAVATFIQEELPGRLPGFTLARVISEGIGEDVVGPDWAVFALQLAAVV